MSDTVPDYRPLTKSDIADLLVQAQQISQSYTQGIATIQCRLSQGIVGMECPNPDEGPVAERQNQLDRLFLDSKALGPCQDTIDQMFTIMTGTSLVH